MYMIFVLVLILIGIYMFVTTFLADRPRNKASLAVKEAFKRVTERHMLSISDMNRFGNRVIAMDSDLAKLVLIVYQNGITWEKYINMEDILFCQVINTGDKDNGHIQKVSLELTFRNDQSDISFPFFDEKLDNPRDVSYRIRKSKYWKRKIQIQMSTRQINNFVQPDTGQAIA